MSKNTAPQPIKGEVIARSIRGEWVEEVSGELWLVKPDAGRERVSDEWLDQAFKSGGWSDENGERKESAFPRREGQEASTTVQPVKGLKKPWLVVLLNLVPFFALANSTVGAASGTSSGFGYSFLLFVWGLGYLYLGRWVRFLFALAAPWVLCLFSFSLRPWDIEHSLGTLEDITPAILILGSACAITAVDAYRLAHTHNARLLGQEGSPVLGKVVARSTFGDRIEQVGDQLWRVRENGQRDVVTKEWLEQALQGSVWKKKEHA